MRVRAEVQYSAGQMGKEEACGSWVSKQVWCQAQVTVTAEGREHLQQVSLTLGKV